MGVRSLVGGMLGTTSIGVFISALLKYFYDNAIWVDEFVVAPNTIEELMFIVIVFFFLLGCIVGSRRS